MRNLKFIKYIRSLLWKSQFRRDVALGVVSIALALVLTKYWTTLPREPLAPGGPAVPHGETPALPAPPKAGEAVQRPTAPAAEDEALPAWRRYAAVPQTAPREPMVAIVLDDMGPNRKGTERALNLPATITFAFLPYAPHVATFAKAARAHGHEILVHVPMEPVGGADPGPHALRADETAEGIRADLAWHLSRFEGYVGINNHMGSRFTANAEDMRVVMEELKARGLLFLDSRTSAETQAANTARAAGLPTLSRDIFLDHDEEGAEVDAELGKLERLARERGFAIAIGHPHAETLDILEKWIPHARASGIAIVPLTAILRRREAS